ncbi:MAG: PDZ domain-containing protein [Planctomycetes bacterium]|nr:PDZ domain-containing protein [Planctomycetota bacterium]
MFRWMLVAMFLAASSVAYGQNEPKKEEKKEEKKSEPAKKPTPGFPDIDEFIKKLPPDLPKVQVEMIRKNLELAKKRFDEGQKRAEDARKRAAQFQRPLPGKLGIRAENRLGVRVEKPGDALIAQLGLAEGKGIVLAEVREGSAAAKAGLKANDILLELAGKEVSSDVTAFTKTLDEIKKDTPVDAVVLRKGKKETVKGITLPETPPQKRQLQLQRRIK